MGLDTVELIMAWEEEFAVTIPDEVAVGLATPGDVIAYLSKMIDPSCSRCRSQRAFHAMRRQARNTLTHFRRSEFRPTTTLDSLVNNRPPRTVLPHLLRVVIPERTIRAIRIPSFRCANTLLWLGFLFATVLELTWVFSSPALPDWVAVPLLCVLLILTFIVQNWIRETALANHLLRNHDTIRDLIENHLPAPIASGRAREEIAQRVREITIDQLGISPAQYREDARFLEDFGCD